MSDRGRVDEMIATLRKLGYRITVPADCRQAGPWRNKATGRRAVWTRVWQNSAGNEGTATAAVVQYTGDGWTWYARLADNSYKGGPYRADGQSGDPRVAMNEADDALQALLLGCRAGRMGAFMDDPVETEAPEGSLGLPPAGDPEGLELG